MKLFLWILLVIPNLLSATAVTLKEWVRPNGTRIVIIGDIHIESEKENQQQDDLISYLKYTKNSHLLVEDPRELGYAPDGFISGLVSRAKQNGVEATSLEFRLISENIAESAQSLRNYLLHINNVPFQTECQKLCDQMLKIKTYSDLMDLMLPIGDFGFLSKIMSDSLKEKDLYVCVGDAHADFFVRAFTDLNYTQGLYYGGYDEQDLLSSFSDCKNKIDKYALDFSSLFN